MAKKQFADLAIADKSNGTLEAANNDYVNQPESMIVSFTVNGTSNRTVYFGKCHDRGYDEIVYAAQKATIRLRDESLQSNKLSLSTVIGYANSALAAFFPFCEILAEAKGNNLLLEDINTRLIQKYIVHLSEGKLSIGSQKSLYTQTKSILKEMLKSERSQSDLLTLFPKNPYPNSNRSYKGQQALSPQELGRLSKSLASELTRIKRETGLLSSYDLAVCMLAISVRTGINPTPLVELPTDCLQPHPLKQNRRLLVSFKRRGNATHLIPLRKSEELSSIKTVMMDVAAIIELVQSRNSQIRKGASSNRLFVYEVKASASKGNTSVMNVAILTYGIKSLVSRNKIVNDDGKPLLLNLSRLRRSFVNRIWRLSGNDPIVTAAMGNHSLSVSNDHYLEAPPEAEKNFSLLGEIRVNQLLDSSDDKARNTPVAKCKDSINGHCAPKNGVHCTEFLACFRCKSFLVTSDDLYRIYSLYWLLVNERKSIGSKRWSRFYAHIIRIIDNDIAPQFDKGVVTDARNHTLVKPHPYWLSNDNLGANIYECSSNSNS